MKAADYRIPWGRPSEHLLAVKREIIGQQLHVRRVQDARNRSTIDTEPPECAHMPHLITRPKKKKIQEDRQREIAAENYSLMHRLAGIMKEERRDPVQKFAHLSVEYRESLRRKKLLKLETENRRLARSIRKQRPFYPNRAMEKEEDERQALLKTMSRTERRKERVAMFKASDRNNHHHHHPGGNAALLSSGRNEQQLLHQQSAATANASLVEDGVLFRPGPTAVRLRTAKQMQLEVARRRQGGGDYDDGQEFFSSESGREGGGAGGGTGGLPLSSSTRKRGSGSLTVKRRAYSSDGAAAAAATRRGGEGIVLEVNRTGGGGGSGGGRRRAASMGGRPNLIFTPSLMPVGMDSVRASPMILGSAGGGSVGSAQQQWEDRQETTESGGGGDALRGGEGGRGAEEATLREPQTEQIFTS